MISIYFVRHAHSHYTPDEYNRPLSEEGWKEAYKLVKVFDTIHIQAVYASCYKRAIETVQPIAESKELLIIQDETLNERVLAKDSVADFASAISKVWAEPTFSFDGGESNVMAQKRVIPTIEKLLDRHQNENIIIGTHGNILTLLLNHFDKRYDITFWQSLKMPDIIVAKFEGSELLSIERLTE
ncbi:histidine phosphatase family protein [Metasolibacillus meyeri]|uniref:Histidine phosphatase family protein n=1 Tax=Metasolibacillus meyeri TaxID=1071052 RepID=A0AAW9NM37_9BACL|nr:histidine phosphatase family protein [Metasolibacillus meyeri]MEC1177516.1 histidine phosphatase family protein [Metasolibacillus meyeri]